MSGPQLAQLKDGVTRFSLWPVAYRPPAPGTLALQVETLDAIARDAVVSCEVIELDAAQVAVLRDALSEWLGSL